MIESDNMDAEDGAENDAVLTPPAIEGDNQQPYTVGYGRPPKNGQIKPGEVRNPRGKAKGTRSFRTEIDEMLEMPVPMMRDGKTRHVTTRKACLLKLREKALKGDSRSLDRLLALAAEHATENVVGSITALLAEDALLLADARLRAGVAPGTSDSVPVDSLGKNKR